MSYIEKNLLPGEQIIFKTQKHYIIFLYPVLLTIIALVAYYYMMGNDVLAVVSWAPGLIALIFWAYAWLEYYFSEFAVTNKRVMMREGFFVRHANEMRIGAISQVNIDQGLIGQMLDYGTVALNAFGAYDSYNIIAKPMQFQRAVNEQLDRARGSV